MFMLNTNRPCEGCIHDGQCGMLMFDGDFYDEDDFIENCCGCACGDGFECNRDNGCENYETEDDIIERVSDICDHDE